MSSEPTTAPAPAAETVEKKEDATTTGAEGEAPAAGAVDADAAAEKAGDKEGEPATEVEKSDAPPKVAETVEAEAKAEATDAPVEATASADAKEAGDDAPAAADAADEPAVASTPVADKSKNRRKSTGTPGGKLSKKASKAKLTHHDAQPGEFYLMKLKGYPQWPVIIADEEMLPEPLLKSRPVSAQRQDGTYREDFAEGGKRVHDRTFPVMYLYTNEFGWVPNSALTDLPSERASEMLTDKVKKKELREAFELAIQQPSLEHFKEVLLAHEESIRQDAEERLEEEKQKAEAKKKKRNSVVAPVVDEEGDFDMADVPDDEPAQKPKSAKKRKAEEAATPQRSESVKKPKIKLTTSSTPKTTNGTSAPKAAKDASKPKVKAKKEVEEKKEPQLTPAELHDRKHKEVLFLRHKLQKGLLAREGIPKEDEMTSMSDFISKLENMPDLEASIIRSTKINKVLKAILKLSSIPKEAEFNFRSRSQTLLDKWNQVLAATEGAAAPGGAPAANGVNGDDKEASAAPAESNGVKDAEKPQEAEKTDKDKASPAVAEEAKSEVKPEETKPEETTDKPAEEAAPPAAKEVDTEA